MESRISMSQRERDVLKVVSQVVTGKRSQVEASRLLGKSVRQVRRIVRRLESEGDEGVIHRLRGRPSNHRCSSELRGSVLQAYRTDYADFGPTLASEKLSERGLSVSADTLRRWLMAEGLWERKRQRDRHRARRERRECFGELVQIDTSIHDWLEGRSQEPIVLVAMIDDATSRVLARFYEGETVEAYMDLLDRWLLRHGRPLAVYTDHDSVFEAERAGEKVAGTTQYSRALEELGIELILANSPQAKGRVERLFGTLQDRWVKELRLAGARTRQAANALVDSKLLKQFNRRFTKKARSGNDAHRPLGPDQNPRAILSIQSRRVVTNDYTVRFQNRIYQLHKPALPGLRGGRVVIEERLDGSLALRFGKQYLQYSEWGALPPDPRSLSREPHPACAEKGDRANRATRPQAVTRTAGRSGRTPAEPYPASSGDQSIAPAPWKPATDHPWRRRFLTPTTQQQPDISIVAK
jgi:transposase